MQTCSSLLSAATLSAVMCAAAAVAADLPKEGTYSGTFSAFGTLRATSIGKERLLFSWDENGLSLTNGFLDHFTWHCFGGSDVVNGVGQDRGYCVGTDPAGDQVVISNIESEKHGPDQKTWTGVGTFSTGTGKYAGITGSGTFVEHGPEFRTAAEGTFVSHSILHGSYKLP